MQQLNVKDSKSKKSGQYLISLLICDSFILMFNLFCYTIVNIKHGSKQEWTDHKNHSLKIGRLKNNLLI